MYYRSYGRLNAHTDMKNTIALFLYTSSYRREDIGTDAGICAINGPAYYSILIDYDCHTMIR